MKKAQAKELLAEADAKGPVHRIKGGWKGMMIFTGVLVSLFVVTLPFGIWFFVVAAKARLGMTEEGFAIRWFGTRGYRWEDIEAFKPVPLSFHVHGHGVVGAVVGAAASKVVSAKTEGLKGPLSFKVRGKRGWTQIPAHAIERGVEMAREMEAHTELSILPPAPEAAEEGAPDADAPPAA